MPRTALALCEGDRRRGFKSAWRAKGRNAPPCAEISLDFTPRERRVLRAVFAGKTNKEIAFTLGVSEPLVKAVLQQLFSKTGVRTRSQLVRIAIERHWKELEGLPE